MTVVRKGDAMKRRISFGAMILAPLLLCLEAMPGLAEDVRVVKSYAACKDTATVERFEEFERRDDDQEYKKLYLSTGASRECIFLRSGEILSRGETHGRWTCVTIAPAGPCYWTATSALETR